MVSTQRSVLTVGKAVGEKNGTAAGFEYLRWKGAKGAVGTRGCDLSGFAEVRIHFLIFSIATWITYVWDCLSKVIKVKRQTDGCFSLSSTVRYDVATRMACYTLTRPRGAGFDDRIRAGLASQVWRPLK